jgi:hypothetical protein
MLWSVAADRANASDLPDQMCDESAGEAHHKDRCDCHGHQVNGPRVVAFAHKVEVARATFVSIQVKMHTVASGHSPSHAEYHLFRPLGGAQTARVQNCSGCTRRRRYGLPAVLPLTQLSRHHQTSSTGGFGS